MPSFEELGLRPELLRTLDDEEIERPTALQEALIPALRRGGNVVARGSTGSGKTLAYVLGVLDRLTATESGEDEVPLRFLVLVPSREAADAAAMSIFPYAQAVGLSVTVPGGTWATPATAAEVLVTPPADIMAAVRGSEVKLDNVEAVVVDGAATIEDLGEWESVDGLLDLLPRDTQRIVLSGAFTPGVNDLVDRRVKRALRHPPEAAVPEDHPASTTGGLGYVLVRGPEKLEVLARQLTQPKDGGNGPPPVLFCRTDERAAEIAERLSVRGFVVGAVSDDGADVAVAAADTTRAELVKVADEGLGQTISYDVPADTATLIARHGGDPDGVVMVEPEEIPHLKEIARAAQLQVRPLALPVDRGVAAAQIEAFRDELRRAVREEDLTAQMLVLGPLFEEVGAAELAAALAGLLRRRAPAAAADLPRDGHSPGVAPAAPGPDAGPAPKPWTRLYVSIGTRDDIRPGDLVGALAGESDIKGSQIGKIEIRDTFSVVEVEADLAERVIRAVNGSTIKGRSVRVDYDRAGARPGHTPQRRQSNRPGGQQRPSRRPGRE